MIKDKRTLRLLVIEDNPNDFIFIEHYLYTQFASPLVTHVGNFADAKAVLTGNTADYDIIILDLSLPDQSGEMLIREIHALARGGIIIVLTGNADIEFSIRSLSMGVADYLLKEEITASSLYKSIIYSIERKKSNTLLEESEKRYSNLFHMSPQPMWVYDPETFRFIQVNYAATLRYGYSEEEFLSMTVIDILPEEDRQQLFKVKTDLFQGRVRHYKKSKELIDVDIYSTPIVVNDKTFKLSIAVDVTEKLLFEHTIVKAIIKAQEDERYEIGSELHDNVCQILAAGDTMLGMMKDSLEPAAMSWFEHCRKNIRLASQEIRNLSHRLAPVFFDDSTMKEAFESLLHNINTGNRYKIALHVGAGIESYPLKREIQLNLYRIIQEQLRNILNHASATAITLHLFLHKDNLVMQIADDGIGFDVHTVKRGIGLANMQRRAELFSGKLDIESSPGKGCTITITIPLQKINVGK